ncbi:L-lactate permease [Microbacterium imperiale]|uniref:L-lactate permease n=1 Tax=Microbacterium imperiale TaxID=33884 RepID=A0A9W6M2C5_9MICO|nr:L-lactate permease [Microbacterium imperiale]MBP2419320.1 lactate permease [Microbacterium imperiale]MDS0198810.1 L-lactate permease [Microbacterium imperiale]BFE39662.1 L-lactate permease [Microbacterium imperiale]GLJ79363.1 L-lactate permease [Microbacterium imperiale]
MWTQTTDPLGSLALSALVAAIPIVVFLVALVVLRLSGIRAGLIALVAQIAVAVFAFGMPVSALAGASLLGALTAVWPIAYIIVMAVWLYKLAVASGRFDVIRSSIGGISTDQRLQVLLISFAFGAFLEGAAGFGVPIAICAALLVQLGFRPVKAAMISLVANAGAGAYGAIGIPVIVGAQVSGIDVHELSRAMVLVLQPLTLLIPFLLVVILDGLRGLRETWPATLVVTVVFSGVQAGVLWFLGPELADLSSGLAAMVALFLLGRVWQPKRVYREPGAPEPEVTRTSFSEVVAAWSPFYILTAVILVWSLPAFKNLFVADGPLAALAPAVPMPGLTGSVQTATGTVVTAAWSFTPINATGTAILLAVLISFWTTPQLRAADLARTFRTTIAELWPALVLITIILVLANIANHSGGSASMGTALAAVGPLFPVLAPIIGWIGVFLTGSVVNNNTLFAPLQVATAERLAVDPALLVGANTAGGNAAKVISPQSIAIAAGAVGLAGRESEILRASIWYSLGMLAFICLWCGLLAALA